MKSILDKYKLVAFDLDGTLVHTTAEYRYFVVPQTLKDLGKDANPIDFHAIDKFWFDGNRDKTIEKYFKCSPKAFWNAFHKLDSPSRRAHYTRLYDDVKPVIYRLKKQGKILAITTGAPKNIAKIELDLLPRQLFAKIISVTSTRYKNKPHPESLLACIKYCGVKSDEAVYIGNSSDDSIYTSSAKVDFLYIERREHTFKGTSIATIHTLFDLLQEE